MAGPIGEAFVTISPDLTGFDTRVLAALEQSLRGIESRAESLSAALDAVDPDGLQRLSAAGQEAAEDLDRLVVGARAADQAIGNIGAEGSSLTLDQAIAEIRTVETASQAADVAVASIGDTPVQLSMDAAIAEIQTVESASQAADAAVAAIGDSPVRLSMDAAIAEIETVETASRSADEAVASIGDTPTRLNLDSAINELDRLGVEAVNADQAIDAINGSPTVNSTGAVANLVNIESAAQQADSAIDTLDGNDVTLTTGGADAAISALIAAINRLDASLATVPGSASRAEAGLRGVDDGAGRAETGIRSLVSQVNPLGSAFAKIGPRLKEIGFEAAAEQASAMVSAIGGAVKSLLTLGVQSAASAEQSQIAFKGLLGSAEEGTAFFEELQQFAAATPFEFEGLAKSAQTFLALGQSTTDVITNLEAVGAAAAAAGASAESIDRVTVALAQIQGAGKLTADNLNQITDALPNVSRTAVFDVLAEKLGITTQEVAKLAETGGILSDDAIPAIIESFRRVPGAAGALEAQAQSLTGIFSTLKDTVKIELVNAFGPLTDVLRESATDVMPVLSASLGDLGEVLAEVAVDAVPLLIDAISAFAPVVTEAIGQIGGFVDDAGSSILDFADVLLEVLEAAEPLKEAFSGLLISNLGTFNALIRALTPILEALGTVLEAIPTPLLSILITLKQFNNLRTASFFTGLTQTLTATKTGFQQAGTQIAATSTSLQVASPYLKGAGDAAAGAAGKVGLATKAAGGLAAGATSLGLAFNPVGLGIAAATVGVGLLASKFQESKAKAAEFEARVKSLAASFKEVIAGTETSGNAIEEFITTEIEEMSDGVREAFAASDIGSEAFVDKILSGGDAIDIFKDRADELGVVLQSATGEALEFNKTNLVDAANVEDVKRLADSFGITVGQLRSLIDETEDWDDGAEEAAKRAVELAEIDGLLNEEQERLIESGATYVKVLAASGTEVQKKARLDLEAALAAEEAATGTGELTDAQEDQIQALLDSNAPGEDWVSLLAEIDEAARIAGEGTRGLGRSFSGIAASIQDEAPAVALAIANLGQGVPALSIETLVDVASVNPEQFKAQTDAIAEATGLTTEAVTKMVEDSAAAFEEFTSSARANLPAVGDEVTKLKDQVSGADYAANLKAQADAIVAFNKNIKTLLASASPDVVNAGLAALELGPNAGARLAQNLVDNINGSLPTEIAKQSGRFTAGLGELDNLITQGGHQAVTAAGVLGQNVVNAMIQGVELNQDEVRTAYEQVRFNAVQAGTKPPTKAEFDFARNSGKKLPEAWIEGAGTPISTLPGYDALTGLPTTAAAAIASGTTVVVPGVAASGAQIPTGYNLGIGDPTLIAATTAAGAAVPTYAHRALAAQAAADAPGVTVAGAGTQRAWNAGLQDPAGLALTGTYAAALPAAASTAVTTGTAATAGVVVAAGAAVPGSFYSGIFAPPPGQDPTAAAAQIPADAAAAVTTATTAALPTVATAATAIPGSFMSGIFDPAAQTGVSTAVTGLTGAVTTALQTASTTIIPAALALGRSLVDQFATGLGDAASVARLQAAASGIGRIVTGAATTGVAEINTRLRAVGTNAARAVAAGLTSGAALAAVRIAGGRVGRAADAGITAVTGTVRARATVFSAAVGAALAAGLDARRSQVQSSATRLANSVGLGLTAALGGVAGSARGFGGVVAINLIGALDAARGAVRAAGTRLADSFASGTASSGALAGVRASAHALRDGFYNVLSDPSFLGRLYNVGAAWVRQVNNGVRTQGLIESPSRLLAKSGLDTAEGYLLGVTDDGVLTALGGAGEDLVAAVITGMNVDLSSAGASVAQSFAEGFASATAPAKVKISDEAENLWDSLGQIGINVSEAEAQRMVDRAKGDFLRLPKAILDAFRRSGGTFFEDFGFRAKDAPKGNTPAENAAIRRARMAARRAAADAAARARRTRVETDLATKGYVRLGEVSERVWERLKKAGWKGRAGDNMEALYPPEVRRAIAKAPPVKIPVEPSMTVAEAVKAAGPVSVPVEITGLDEALAELVLDPITIPVVLNVISGLEDASLALAPLAVATRPPAPDRAGVAANQPIAVTFAAGSIVVQAPPGMTPEQAAEIGESIGEGIEARIMERRLAVVARAQA